MTKKRESTRRIDRRNKDTTVAIGTVISTVETSVDSTVATITEPTDLVLVSTEIKQQYQSAQAYITVEWEQPESASPAYYTLEWSYVNTFSEITSLDTINTEATFAAIPDSIVYVRVKAVSGVANSEYTDTLIIYSPQDTTSIVYTKPAGGADGIILSGLHEFALSPTLITDSDGHTPNAVYNMLVSGSNPIKTDIEYTTETHLRRLKSVTNVIIPVHWFTSVADYSLIKPGIGYRARTKLANPSTDWLVSSYTVSTAYQFPSTTPYLYGTSDDTAFITGARYFKQKGYHVGIAPVVRFIDTTKTQELEWEIPRGEVNQTHFATLGIFTSWLTQYKSYVLYYVDLLLNYGIVPSIVYLGSEMKGLSQSSNYDFRIAWIEALQSLADSIKSRNSNILTTYAANFDEYSYNLNTAPLDPIWSYVNIDTVGVQWFQPQLLEHSNYPADFISKENYEVTLSGLDANQRYVQTSSGIGKRNVSQTQLDAGFASKNVKGFIEGAHYIPSGSIPGASPLQGSWRNSRTLHSDLSGTVRTTTLLPAKGYGLRPASQQRDTWLVLDGTKYGTFTMPDYAIASGLSSYIVELDFRYYGSNNSRLLRGSGVIDVYVDSGGLRAAITKQDGSTFYSSAMPLTSGSDYLVKYEVSTPYSAHSKVIISRNNTQYEYTSLSGQATMPISSGVWYVGAFDSSTNYFNGRLYYQKIEGIRSIDGSLTNGKSIGGIYYFDDSYAGIRTAWLPELKPIIATSVGFASINGGAIEPATQIALVSGQAYTLPSGLRAKTTYWDQMVASGLSVSNLYGPYGSTFNEDQNQQALALQTTVDQLRENNFKSIIVSTLDIRPPETLLVGISGQLWYKDGPKQLINHNIANKRAGGK